MLSVTKKGMEQEVVDGGKQLRVGGSETKGERFKGEKREEAWGRGGGGGREIKDVKKQQLNKRDSPPHSALSASNSPSVSGPWG